jgi:hypothetical protein
MGNIEYFGPDGWAWSLEKFRQEMGEVIVVEGREERRFKVRAIFVGNVPFAGGKDQFPVTMHCLLKSPEGMAVHGAIVKLAEIGTDHVVPVTTDGLGMAEFLLDKSHRYSAIPPNRGKFGVGITKADDALDGIGVVLVQGGADRYLETVIWQFGGEPEPEPPPPAPEPEPDDRWTALFERLDRIADLVQRIVEDR